MATYVERYWTYDGSDDLVDHPPASWEAVLIPWAGGWMNFNLSDPVESLQWAISDQCAGRFCIGSAEHRLIGYAGIESDDEMFNRIHRPTHVLFAFSDPRAAVEFRMRFG